MERDLELEEKFEADGDNHFSSAVDTPMKADAFKKSDSEKIKNIEHYFACIMDELGLDLTDDSLKGTPHRVAKMYVREMFQGLNPANKPKLSVFENKYQYNKMLVETDITIHSACEHHFLPIVGKAHVAYISNGKVIGLSKINRLVDFYARRPQVQERLTRQIFEDLKKSLKTESVIVVIDAEHLCVSARGVKDPSSRTTTLEYAGAFNDLQLRQEFFAIVNNTSK